MHIPRIEQQTITDTLEDMTSDTESIERFIIAQPDLVSYTFIIREMFKASSNIIIPDSTLILFAIMIIAFIKAQIEKNNDSLNTVADYVAYIGSKPDMFLTAGVWDDKKAYDNMRQTLKDFLRQVR